MSTQYQTPQAPEPEKLTEPRLTSAQIAQTLAELVSMGFVKTVKDAYGITRYKSTARRIQPTVETHDDFVA